jgi:hypothetical protein
MTPLVVVSDAFVRKLLDTPSIKERFPFVRNLPVLPKAACCGKTASASMVPSTAEVKARLLQLPADEVQRLKDAIGVKAIRIVQPIGRGKVSSRTI